MIWIKLLELCQDIIKFLGFMWEVEVLDAVDINFMSRREKGKEHIRTDLLMNKLHSTYTSIELFCLGN